MVTVMDMATARKRISKSNQSFIAIDHRGTYVNIAIIKVYIGNVCC